jgi:hypothetical protein
VEYELDSTPPIQAWDMAGLEATQGLELLVRTLLADLETVVNTVSFDRCVGRRQFCRNIATRDTGAGVLASKKSVKVSGGRSFRLGGHPHDATAVAGHNFL